MNHNLLQERARVLHSIISATHEQYFHSSVNEGQRGLYETILGAAIWYLPGGDELFSGKISIAALESLRTDPDNTKLVEEHSFPRKVGGKYLFELFRNHKGGFSEADLVEVYKSKLGRFNLVLKSENDRLKKWQKTGNFIDSESIFLNAVSGIEEFAYTKAGIVLCDFSVEAYQDFKKYKNKRNSKRFVPHNLASVLRD